MDAQVRDFVSAFPWLRVAFAVRLRERLAVDQYLGGMLRGAIGWPLQQLLCRRPGGRVCEAACGRPQECGFGLVWDTRPAADSAYGRAGERAPGPLIVEGPPVGEVEFLAGATVEFSVVLVGPAREYLPQLIEAVRLAGERGLGSARVRFALAGLSFVDAAGRRPAFDPFTGALAMPAGPGALPRWDAEHGARLDVLTPMNLRVLGEPLRAAPLPLSALVRALCRRIGILADHYAPHLRQPDWHALAGLADGAPPLAGELRWFAWKRRSCLQDRSMVLGGVVGSLRWPGVPDTLAPLLALGSVVHVGKNASLGLGHYALLPIDATSS